MFRMPTVDVPEIRVKTAFNGLVIIIFIFLFIDKNQLLTFKYCFREVMITYIDPRITVDQLRYEMRVICRFSPDQDFTMKWVDEEGILIVL